MRKRHQFDEKKNEFLFDFVPHLEPRFFLRNSIVQEQYEEIFEVLFLTKGLVGIGYRLFNEPFFGKQILVTKDRRILSVINDYSSLENKCSEFLYRAIDASEALAVRKENFNEVIFKSYYGKKLMKAITKRYKKEVQAELYEHRDDKIL